VAPTSLDGQLAVTKVPARLSSTHQPRRRGSTVPARSRRPNRREADQDQSRESSQERAERKEAERAAKWAAKVAALEREWKVQQVAGELGRQADLLERHRYLVAKYGASDALDHFDTEQHIQQVSSFVSHCTRLRFQAKCCSDKHLTFTITFVCNVRFGKIKSRPMQSLT